MKISRPDLFVSFLIVHLLILSTGVLYGQDQLHFDFETPYGNNAAVGKYMTVNGIEMYYEEYGTGQPMLLIHGNGANINTMGHQIEYFKRNYRVIAADSRGHGLSGLNTDSLTYVQIADDWAELANQLHLDSLYIIGWSDGGIVGLLLAIDHPEKVRMLAAMGANLRPDTTAVYPWAVTMVGGMRDIVEGMLARGDRSNDWNLLRQYVNLLGHQPTISPAELSEIQAPVLVLCGDKDIIREEHSVEIYQHIPHAQLCIFPGATHFIPATDPELFNATVARFFAQPFTRPDSREFME